MGTLNAPLPRGAVEAAFAYHAHRMVKDDITAAARIDFSLIESSQHSWWPHADYDISFNHLPKTTVYIKRESGTEALSTSEAAKTVGVCRGYFMVLARIYRI